MARDFSVRPDIDNTDPANYPDGRIKDSSPAGAKNGTAINEAVLGDIYQFFLKLLRDASIAENGNPDNTSNGYQLVDALINKITSLAIVNDGNTASFTQIKTKVLEIGDWNMDINNTTTVPHGIDRAKIRSVSAYIIDDANTQTYSLEGVNIAGTLHGGIRIDNTNIILDRAIGGAFDASFFDSISYNRGWVIVTYEE